MKIRMMVGGVIVPFLAGPYHTVEFVKLMEFYSQLSLVWVMLVVIVDMVRQGNGVFFFMFLILGSGCRLQQYFVVSDIDGFLWWIVW